jgi:hypothetical protein
MIDFVRVVFDFSQQFCFNSIAKNISKAIRNTQLTAPSIPPIRFNRLS